MENLDVKEMRDEITMAISTTGAGSGQSLPGQCQTCLRFWGTRTWSRPTTLQSACCGRNRL